METTQTSFKKSLKKGAYAEELVQAILESEGWVVYRPSTGGAHAFDMLAIRNKSECMALDVKAKAERDHYPDTGINIKHYNTYANISKHHKLVFWLVFVDEKNGKIYGNQLSKLEQPTTIKEGEKVIEYPLMQKGIIYFPTGNMIPMGELSDVDKQELAKDSQRNSAYS